MNRSQTSGRVGSAVFLLLFFLFLLPFLHVLRGGGHLALLVESGGDAVNTGRPKVDLADPRIAVARQAS